MPAYSIEIRETDNAEPFAADDWNLWGGDSLCLRLVDPRTNRPQDFEWLFCGEEFIQNMFKACGDYLTRKAHNARA